MSANLARRVADWATTGWRMISTACALYLVRRPAEAMVEDNRAT
jgi:hypothetical protein